MGFYGSERLPYRLLAVPYYHLEPLNFCGYELVKASLINDYQNLFCWLINSHQLKPVGGS